MQLELAAGFGATIRFPLAYTKPGGEYELRLATSAKPKTAFIRERLEFFVNGTMVLRREKQASTWNRTSQPEMTFFPSDRWLVQFLGRVDRLRSADGFA
jgi:hypothetical protein